MSKKEKCKNETGSSRKSDRKVRKIPLPPWAAAYESENRAVYAQQIKGKVYFSLYEKRRNERDIYLGSITEAEGLKPARSHNSRKEESSHTSFDPLASFPTCDLEVYEYGFSRAMLDLGEPICRNLYPDNAKELLTALILDISPNSYLKMSPNRSDPCARGVMERKLNNSLPVSVHVLFDTLGSISLIVGEDGSRTSRLSDEQKKFCQTHHLQIGGV